MVSLSLLLGVNLALHSVREGQVGRGRDPLDRFDGLIFGFRVFVREGDGRACHGMFVSALLTTPLHSGAR